MITDNTSPLFWRCDCPGNVIHFSDDDNCERCGASEAESPNANVGCILSVFPFISLDKIPQQTLQGIFFAGEAKVHSGHEAQSCVEVAFFKLRELLRNHIAGDMLSQASR
jgi:hypothetical protein